MRRTTKSLFPMALVLGAITLLVSAPIAEAGPKVRVRSGNSIHVRTTNSPSVCAPSRSHRSYSHHRHHNHRHYGHHRGHRNYGNHHHRSSVKIHIGGGYSGGCYTLGRTYRTYPSYSYHSYPTYNYYSYGTPVRRTGSSYTVISPDREPSYGTTTLTSAERYRQWQETGRFSDTRRTETVAERPREPLLRDNDLSEYEREIREAARLIREDREAAARARTTAADDGEGLSEPPLGTGSTPTSADEEFQESEPDELSRAWSTLLDGDVEEARALFADAARVTPKKGEARLGYVIASLRDNDRRAASISMVRLLESEPQLVRGGSLPSGTVLDSELERIAETLKAYQDDAVTKVENRMLIAFVNLLQGDVAEAQEAMRRARSAGAEGIAARNMWRLVGLSDKPLERLTEH